MSDATHTLAPPFLEMRPAIFVLSADEGAASRFARFLSGTVDVITASDLHDILARLDRAGSSRARTLIIDHRGRDARDGLVEMCDSLAPQDVPIVLWGDEGSDPKRRTRQGRRRWLGADRWCSPEELALLCQHGAADLFAA